ncbi:Sad1-interacting factor 3 [Malassezia cuniculi]|uniref:Sad1-interacting factor 3 n=1 Tax=Malassezia cuniculi TaxID=948313 RepID=A0AAF0J7U0_9BASI|nr:Sad1-interacting factor 3 [Malassezia cuniculi]
MSRAGPSNARSTRTVLRAPDEEAPMQRRNAGSLPGISSTASMLRSRRAASGRPTADESDTFEVETPGDAALDELGAGIVTPRAKGARPAHPAVDGEEPRPKTTLKGPLTTIRSQLNRPARISGGQRASAQLKGTPARVPRYSLPVRADKPVRASKVSGKHVLLPSDGQLAPMKNDEEEVPRHMLDPVYQTFERIPPALRESTELPRLTSYSIGTGIHMPTLLGFLRREHGVRPRLYEGCAYVMYFKPLLPGFGRATIRSSREPHSGRPGTESRHERELQQREESGYVGTYFESEGQQNMDDRGFIQGGEGEGAPSYSGENDTSTGEHGEEYIQHDDSGEAAIATHVNHASHDYDCKPNDKAPLSVREALQTGELIILPYGVIVLFNFSPEDEESVVEDVIASGSVRGVRKVFERETFHYCYDPDVPAPRIYNDFFTFRTPNHLLKLSLAHAIAQSTKLSEFEDSMHHTLELTSHIPRELAQTGELRVSRRGALRMSGRLFKLRVDVNLTSDVLDTPDLFWNEASLQALYDAIREYLEIDERAQTLNERLAVANDLLEIIHEHLNNNAMSKITWIIIALIVAACIVAVGEISARLLVHAKIK